MCGEELGDMDQLTGGPPPEAAHARVACIVAMKVLAYHVLAVLAAAQQAGEVDAKVVVRAFADQQGIAAGASGLVDEGAGCRPVGFVEHGLVQRRKDVLEGIVWVHATFSRLHGAARASLEPDCPTTMPLPTGLLVREDRACATPAATLRARTSSQAAARPKRAGEAVEEGRRDAGALGRGGQDSGGTGAPAARRRPCSWRLPRIAEGVGKAGRRADAETARLPFEGQDPSAGTELSTSIETIDPLLRSHRTARRQPLCRPNSNRAAAP